MRRDVLLLTGYVGVFLAITAVLAAGGPLVELDLAVDRWAAAHRPVAAELVARVLNRFGQGLWLLAICAALAGWLALLRWQGRQQWSGWQQWSGRQRWWRVVAPLAYVAAAAGLLIPTVLVIKRVTNRGAPSSSLPPEQTVDLLATLPPGEYAAGYPGGHAVNTIVWYGVLLALVTALLHAYGRSGPPRAVRLAVRVAPPVIVLFTTTYLSFHWLTDGLAGIALGLAIDRALHLGRRAARRRPHHRH